MNNVQIIFGAANAGGFGVYLMNFDKWPIWVHAGVIAYAVLLFAVSGTKIYRTFFPKEQASIVNTQGVNAPENSGEITNKASSAERAKVVNSPAAKVQSADVIKDSSRTQIQDNRKYAFNLFSMNIDIPGVSLSSYKGRREMLDRSSADVRVHVLWKDASWYFGSTRFNEAKLQQFLRSPEYRDEIKEATAILCVGLSSNWVDAKGTTFMTDQKSEVRVAEESKADERAFKLCQLLSQRAQELGAKPQFFGFGLGYHVDKARDADEDSRQRSIVLLTIKTDSKKSLSPQAAKTMLEQVMGANEIKEFEGHRYSKVVDGRRICWMETFNATFVANGPDCD